MQVWVDNGDGSLDSAVTTATGAVPLNQESPVLTSAGVSGNVVTLAFDNPLQTPVSASTLASAFTAESAGAADGVSSAALSGDTVTLTLDTAPASGAATTFSYTASTGNLRSGYGAMVPNLANQSVTNNN